MENGIEEIYKVFICVQIDGIEKRIFNVVLTPSGNGELRRRICINLLSKSTLNEFIHSEALRSMRS